MTDYVYYEGEIRTGNTMVGWIGENSPNPFDCLISIKGILESHGHTLKVEMFRNDFEIVPAEPYIREVSGGVYISDRVDDLNYAFFSNDMNCSKLCVKAVLKIFKETQ